MFAERVSSTNSKSPKYFCRKQIFLTLLNLVPWKPCFLSSVHPEEKIKSLIPTLLPEYKFFLCDMEFCNNACKIVHAFPCLILYN